MTVLPDAEQVVRYCSEGHASFSVTGQEIEVEGASCEDRGMFFLAHFGTNYSDESAARGEYLGLVLEEVPDSGVSTPRISALELTVQGHRQPVSEAAAEVERNGDELSLTVTGSIDDGTDLKIVAHCAID